MTLYYHVYNICVSGGEYANNSGIVQTCQSTNNKLDRFANKERCSTLNVIISLLYIKVYTLMSDLKVVNTQYVC